MSAKTLPTCEACNPWNNWPDRLAWLPFCTEVCRECGRTMVIPNCPDREMRLPLYEHLLYGHIEAWQQHCAIFGDWLEERSRPEQYAARAEWRLVQSPSHRWILKGGRRVQSERVCTMVFRVPLAFDWYDAEFSARRDCVNSLWLLGFPPGTLRFKGNWPAGMYRGQRRMPTHMEFRWMPVGYSRWNGDFENATKSMAHWFVPYRTRSLFDTEDS